jgi:hypothetical protein
MQAKMSHQYKQMRIAAREGFACVSVKLAFGNSYEVDSNTFFF